MKKSKTCFSLFCLWLAGIWNHNGNAQGILPVNRYVVPRILDRVTVASSFAYSLRKVRNAYSGYAVKVRRAGDNAEGDVAFDAGGIVGSGSLVTITAPGSGSLVVGQQLSYNTFKGSQTVTVKTWYDQGPLHYNAAQATNSKQPVLLLNSAGSANNKPSVVFNGAQNLDVAQPIQNLVNNGIAGSFLLWTKPTANTVQTSFGVQLANNWRWFIHLNWIDGNLYFDAGESCCAANRLISNGANLNLYKQYSFIRGLSYKTLRINSAVTGLNNASAPSVPSSGGSFYIGAALNVEGAGYSGNACELFMFPTDLPVSTLSILEADQISFWSN